ncbi:hypothetical protein N0V82_007706 [Gnomoniopsis sp. IMI 355080]|nr:hypothetical protein N0V82_007706 [Gnomoniopsis sp. IMI 355080]
MDGLSKTFQIPPSQHQDEDDLTLPEEEFVYQEVNVAQLDDDLMLSDGEFDQTNAAQGHDDVMLPEVDLNAVRDLTAQYSNTDIDMPYLVSEDASNAQRNNLTQYNDLALDIPHYLPENALVTDSFSLVHADGHQERYLTMLNTPIDNYVAQKINDGHEFAIGGDPSHIFTSLDQEFALRPQQRWHVVVMPEDSLQLAGVPRRSYPLVSGMTEGSFQRVNEGVQIQHSINSSDNLAESRPLSPVRQVYCVPGFDDQADRGFSGLGRPRQDSFGDSLMSGGSAHYPPHHAFGNPDYMQQGHIRRRNIDTNRCMVTNGPIQVPMCPSGDHGPERQPRYDRSHTTSAQQDPPQTPTFPEYSRRKRSRQVSTDHEKFQKEEEERKKEDAATIEADDRFESYSGTDLCRWCGRRGHEAVQCIKWDPEHFDKLVCIVCNNKKHSIDECLRFDALPDEDKAKLLVTHCVKDLNDSAITAFPMTRAFIRSLESSKSNGKMWANLWKTFPYGDCHVPQAFHDRQLVLKGQDECFDIQWPLIIRDGDQVSVSPAQELGQANEG